jgi:hypothetical protein
MACYFVHIRQKEKIALEINLFQFNLSSSFKHYNHISSIFFSRYGIHVACNGYYLCYDVNMIKKIFNDIRTMDKGKVMRQGKQLC